MKFGGLIIEKQILPDNSEESESQSDGQSMENEKSKLGKVRIGEEHRPKPNRTILNELDRNTQELQQELTVLIT